MDFFTNKEFNVDIVANLDGTQKTISKSNNSIELIVDNTKVTFLYFAYPKYEKIRIIEDIRISSPIDIGLMKLLALQGRSTKKDIIDLYFIDKKVISLERLLDIFEQFYPKESFNSYDSFKRLINKEDLISQPDPELTKEVQWEKCYQLVKEKVNRHLIKLLQ